MSFKAHAVVEVNSRNRTSGEVENFRTELNQMIKLRSGVRYMARAENIRLPISFFQIDSNFNTFSWDEEGVATHSLSISVPEGSYTISELITQLEIDMEIASAASGDVNTYTITYSAFDNLVNIAFDTTGVDGTDITIQAGTLNAALGYLGDGTETIALAANLDASQSAETRRRTYINILSKSLPITNYFRKIGKQPIIAHIPITGDRWDYEVMRNDNGYMVQLNSDNINELQIQLEDEYGNSIDMRGSNFSFQLVIYRQKNIADKIIEGFARLMGNKKVEKEMKERRGGLK